MAHDPLFLLATDHAAPGVVYVKTLGAVLAMATTTGDDSRGKRSPNEDSAVALSLPGGGLAAMVADAHFGPSSGEIAVRTFARRATGGPLLGPAELASIVIACDGDIRAQREGGDRSETTALGLSVTGRRLSWASAGDSLLLLCRGGRLEVLTADGRSPFLGVPVRWAVDEGDDPSRWLAPLLDTGSLDLRPGDVVLACSDGIDPRDSGLGRSRIEELLRAPSPLAERLTALVDEGGHKATGGGRDNLTVVAIEVDVK